MQKGLQHVNQVKYLDALHNVHLLPVIFESPPSLQSTWSTQKLKEIFHKNSKIWAQASELSEKVEPLTDLMQSPIQRRYLFILSGLLHEFVLQKTVKEVKKQNLLEY